MSLATHTQMDGLDATQQSEKAIHHILERIRDDRSIGWYLGWGTQTFSLLTEAYATLTNQPVREVRDQYEPIDAKNPAE